MRASDRGRRDGPSRSSGVVVWLCAMGALGADAFQSTPRVLEPLKFHDEQIEVTEAGTLRRRYRVRGDYSADVAASTVAALGATEKRNEPPRPFRLGCVFLKDATITCPDVPGEDGKPLRAVYSTPADFVNAMRTTAAPLYGEFVFAYTQGAVKCEWVAFETLEGLRWEQGGKTPAWGCQPKAVAEQLESALSKHQDSKVDLWIWCAGAPRTLNGNAKLRIARPPFGISYTQWRFRGAYNAVVCAPDLALVVHEINHRYLDNLTSIEGIQLTQPHGLHLLGYDRNDLGYEDLLAAYRSVYLHLIRPAMWRRFALTDSAQPPKPPAFEGKLYRWSEVRDDCWFRLPLLSEGDLARLTNVPGLGVAAKPRTRVRAFVVPENERARLRSPYREGADEEDSALNNVLSLGRESCAVLHTDTGHWLIVRPEVADVFVEMRVLRGRGEPLDAAGWLNDGICPLVVLRAPSDVTTPEREIDYFR